MCWSRPGNGSGRIAVPAEVDVLARSESVAILKDRVTGLAEASAGRLAVQLGDLPLAHRAGRRVLGEDHPRHPDLCQ
jgi:hypothetical protein